MRNELVFESNKRMTRQTRESLLKVFGEMPADIINSEEDYPQIEIIKRNQFQIDIRVPDQADCKLKIRSGDVDKVFWSNGGRYVYQDPHIVYERTVEREDGKFNLNRYRIFIEGVKKKV